MQRLFYLLLTIGFLSIFIAVHEFGHFIAARKLGIKVNEFAIGMGPKLFQTKPDKKGCVFTLRLFPIGGFCSLENEMQDSDSPDSFYNQKGWKKVIVLSAGSLMNFLCGFLMVIALVHAADSFAVPEIKTFMDRFPLESEEQLLPGDEILMINGNLIFTVPNVGTYLDEADGNATLLIRRDGQFLVRENLPLTRSNYIDEDGQLREGYYGITFNTVTNPNILQTIDYAIRSVLEFTRMVWNSIQGLFSGQYGLSEMAGVVGVMDQVSDIGTATEETLAEADQDGAMMNGVHAVTYCMAIIAINLAVMNMLPLPALDGGQIFFIFLNWVLGLFHVRKIPPHYERCIHGVGLILFLILTGVITIQDIWRVMIQ